MSNRKALPALMLGVSVVLGGCTTSSGTSTSATAAAADPKQKAIIAEQQQQISSLQEQIQARDAQLSAAQQSQASAPPVSAGSGLFPPNPKPGQCYARVLIPAEYSSETETVLVKEASERVEIIPASYDTVDETVVVKEASARLEVIPATYEEVTERILVQPESKKIVEVPATYKTVSETLLVSPARTEWKRGPAADFAGTGAVLDSRTTDTGEIMCLVDVPAVYETVTRTVVDTPARTREEIIPAQYRTVTKRVVKTPATTREVMIPAEYSTVQKTKLVQPASERRIEIPAQYDNVMKRKKVSEERLEWRQVVCEVNFSASNLALLQGALADAGHYAGPVDGVLGHLTLKGANSYAKSNGLPTGSNYIAMEVVESLGLSF